MKNSVQECTCEGTTVLSKVNYYKYLTEMLTANVFTLCSNFL